MSKDETPPPRRAARLSYLGFLFACTALFIALIWLADLALGQVPWYTPWPARELTNQRLSEVHVSMREFSYVATTDAAGLREDSIPPKDPDVFRIVVIGDSYVYGWGVNEVDRWTEKLQPLLARDGRKIEVINAGAGGHSPLEYTQRAAFVIPELQPDLLLVSILQGSDLTEIDSEVPLFFNLTMLIKDWMRSEELPIQPTLHRVDTDATRRGLTEIAAQLHASMPEDQRSRFNALDADIKDAFFNAGLQCGMVNGATRWPEHYLRLVTDDTGELDGKQALLSRLLQRIRSIAEHYGARTVSLVMPEGALVNREAHEKWKRLGFSLPPEVLGSLRPEEVILEASRSAGIDCLNLAVDFRAHMDEQRLYYATDTHMSPSGHELVAESLALKLEEYLP